MRVKDPLGRQWLFGFGINTELHLFGASSLKEAGYKGTVGLMITGFIPSREGELHRNLKKHINYMVEPRQKLLSAWSTEMVGETLISSTIYKHWKVHSILK